MAAITNVHKTVISTALHWSAVVYENNNSEQLLKESDSYSLLKNNSEMLLNQQ